MADTQKQRDRPLTTEIPQYPHEKKKRQKKVKRRLACHEGSQPPHGRLRNSCIVVMGERIANYISRSYSLRGFAVVARIRERPDETHRAEAALNFPRCCARTRAHARIAGRSGSTAARANSRLRLRRTGEDSNDKWSRLWIAGRASRTGSRSAIRTPYCQSKCQRAIANSSPRGARDRPSKKRIVVDQRRPLPSGPENIHPDVINASLIL